MYGWQMILVISTLNFEIFSEKYKYFKYYFYNNLYHLNNAFFQQKYIIFNLF